MAKISCLCRAVCVEFNADKDLFRVECCCHDCRAALWFAHEQGGPACPEYNRVDNSWLPNDFVIVSGKEHIGAFLNFENGDTTRFHCAQCWTVLFGDHPAYAERILVTPAKNYREYDALSEISLMPPQGRNFLKDLTAEEVEELPVWKGNSEHVYKGVAENLMSSLPSIHTLGRQGEMNAQKLLKKIGTPFVPSGVRRLIDGPPTLMQQADDGN